MTLHVELSNFREKVLSFLVVFLWPEDECWTSFAIVCWTSILQLYVEQVLQFKLRYKICKWNFSIGKKNCTAMTQIFTGNY